jgi:hypothetical protein
MEGRASEQLMEEMSSIQIATGYFVFLVLKKNYLFYTVKGVDCH